MEHEFCFSIYWDILGIIIPTDELRFFRVGIPRTSLVIPQTIATSHSNYSDKNPIFSCIFLTGVQPEMKLHQLNDTIPTSILGVPMHLQILMNQAPVSSLVFGFAICYYNIGYRGDSNHLSLDHFRSPFPSISFGSFLTPLDEHKWTGKDVEVVPRSGREAGTPITFELGMTEQGKPQVM